jgi:CheY-like chemotaxis protein
MSAARSLKVLVADDNPVNQRIMVALLRQLGHTGAVVGDGEKALRCLERVSIDLVLLDVMMPVMDGLQALAALRSSTEPRLARLPVIMVTANDLPGDREQYLGRGANGYVTKPVEIGALSAEIDRVMGAH